MSKRKKLNFTVERPRCNDTNWLFLTMVLHVVICTFCSNKMKCDHRHLLPVIYGGELSVIKCKSRGDFMWLLGHGRARIGALREMDGIG